MAVIRASHRPLTAWFFRLYSEVILRRQFRPVRIHGEFIDQGLPVLLIGNHFSWYDGFIASHLNDTLFKRKFHIMMLEAQLKGRMFLNSAGAYSIRKNSRSALESLTYTNSLLKNPGHLVVLYPQGVFQPISQSCIRFERGIERIIQNFDRPVHLMFYAALVDYFEHRRPRLDIYFRELDMKGPVPARVLEEQYNIFYSECIANQSKLA